MRIQELLAQVDLVVGKPVTISGRVVVMGDDRAFLTSSAEAFERQESLLIQDGSRIAEHLLHTLSAYVGGPFLYDEECAISGTIEQGPDLLQLCDLRRCKVLRHGLVIEVPVSGK